MTRKTAQTQPKPGTDPAPFWKRQLTTRIGGQRRVDIGGAASDQMPGLVNQANSWTDSRNAGKPTKDLLVEK